jgi:hypothetical protein
MSKIETEAGVFIIEHEVPYLQFVIYAVDDNGETDFNKEIHEFDQERADNVEGYWNITHKGQLVESVADFMDYKRVVAYIEYLAGWLETHPDDYVPFGSFS